MSTSPLYLLPRDPPPLQVALPIALTEVDVDPIAAAISAARTESTRRIDAYTWGQLDAETSGTRLLCVLRTWAHGLGPLAFGVLPYPVVLPYAVD